LEFGFYLLDFEFCPGGTPSEEFKKEVFMKKLLIIALTIHCSIITIHCISQSCLPEGIYFFNQAEIDNFQSNYPGCTVIEGNVDICGEDISNLNGLNVLSAIEGNLDIEWSSLQNLTGLDNLKNINGNLHFSWNGLTKLTGLEGLTSIGGSFVLNGEYQLQGLNGLAQLASIGGHLVIGTRETGNSGGTSLESLRGLEGLDSIYGTLYVTFNGQLTSISALDGLKYLGGDLFIVDNHLLTVCRSDWLCKYLQSPNGSVIIDYNDQGCNSVIEVGGACNESIPCLPYGHYDLNTQEDIDNFQNVFPGCTELEGRLFIIGSASSDKSSYSILDSQIFNLNGLNIITSIGGGLFVCSNELLTTLAGLDEVTYIGGFLEIAGNDALYSLSGLEGLDSIRGGLYIHHNDALTSLAGLDNIQSGTIERLEIFHNLSLSSCAVESVCDYLASPNWPANIYSNAPGCNSPEEVDSACIYVSVPEKAIKDNMFSIFPNPCKGAARLRYQIHGTGSTSGRKQYLISDLYSISGLRIRRLLGEEKPAGTHELEVDMTGLPAGVYFCTLLTEDGVETVKLVKY